MRSVCTLCALTSGVRGVFFMKKFLTFISISFLFLFLLPLKSIAQEEVPFTSTEYNGGQMGYCLSSNSGTLNSMHIFWGPVMDVNQDTFMTLGDVISFFEYLFNNGEVNPITWSGLDANRDGQVNISDGIVALDMIFTGEFPRLYFEGDISQAYGYCFLDADFWKCPIPEGYQLGDPSVYVNLSQCEPREIQ